jgi:hypothetical protein
MKPESMLEIPVMGRQIWVDYKFTVILSKVHETLSQKKKKKKKN